MVLYFKFPQNKATSNDTSESTIINHIISNLGEYIIAELNSTIIQKYINLENKVPSKSTVKKIYCELNQFFKYIFSEGIIEINPLTNVQLPKNNTLNENKKIKIFADEEIEKLKKVINLRFDCGKKVYEDSDIFLLILNTGIREGESLALKNGDIDLTNRTMKINKSIHEIKRRNSSGEFI